MTIMGMPEKFEKNAEQEGMSEAKRELLRFEMDGKYVFHGSPLNLNKLEPRQAFDFDKEKGGLAEDGKPAVCATDRAEVAIAKAIFWQRPEFAGIFHWLWGYEVNEKGEKSIVFEASRNTLEQLKAIKDKLRGYIHVFSKSGFEQYRNDEWRTYKEVNPEKVIEVRFEDLPDIKIIEDEKPD
ncbi:MAG: hypothetical protein V1845_01415 [bacterium]